ncbi:MAG: hypothetical protein VX835_04540 [Pseudomonadota bacterium]|nr:hypothetical protein [Pseudomonadota bacterium]
MLTLEANFLELLENSYAQRTIVRTEGILYSKSFNDPAQPTLIQLLNSGYTLHLDLQNLNIENRQKVWNELVKNQSIKKKSYNPFHYRRHSDQFGILHEEYNISWLDWSGMMWSYFNHHWHTQAFHHPDNYQIFRSSKQPELVMLRKLKVDKQTQVFQPKRDKNVISIQFFENIPTIFSSDIFSKSPDDYHKAANKKISCSRMLSCSAATLIALLIWGLFQYPPSTIFIIGLLATIGIPFFSYNIALLGIISLASIVISIIINYIYLTISPDVDINFWQTLNKIFYNVAFIVLPLMILICVPAAALNINLLIIAGIAGLFALYHYMCLNTWHTNETKSVYDITQGLFGFNHDKLPRNTQQSAQFGSEKSIKPASI